MYEVKIIAGELQELKATVSNHGGPRPGAGRKPGVPLAGAAHRTRRIILLSDGEYQQARELGTGNASAGVRRALAVAMNQDSATDPPPSRSETSSRH